MLAHGSGKEGRRLYPNEALLLHYAGSAVRVV